MAHDYEAAIKCPYCDYIFSDSWEYNNDCDERINCEECGEQFFLEVDIDVTYSTEKINCDDLSPPQKHEFGEPSSILNSQRTCDRWNKKAFLGRTNHKPHRMWKRECKNCDHDEYIKTKPDGKCPW